MVHKTYFLSKNGEQIGPFGIGEVLQKIQRQESSWFDYVFTQGQNDWIMLMEHPAFTHAFNSSVGRPESRPIPATPRFELRPDAHLRDKEWYLLKDGNNYGPFSQLEVVQKLQEKSLFEFDYAWHQSLTSWKRLAEIPQYSVEAMRALVKSDNDDVTQVFFRRRHARASYGCSLLVHNSKCVFKGHSLEISEGGAGVIVGDSAMEIGQSIFLHFQPGDGVPPFNATCKVVSRRWVEGEGAGKPIQYGVQFTNIALGVRESIRKFTSKNKSAA